MKREGWPRLVGLVLAGSVLQGCYSYVPIEPAAVSRGTVVRARMSGSQSFDLREITAHNIVVVDGELVRAGQDSVVLSALWLDAASGNGYPGEGWTVGIPAASVQELAARRVSKWKTAALVVAGAVATYVGFDALGGSGGSRTKGGGGGSTL